MSVIDSVSGSRGRLADLPAFELCYGVDDPDVPTRVTVYEPSMDAIDTHWISIDVDWAIDLEAVA